MTEPLTPPECDLRDFEFMPLKVVRLRDSAFTAKASGDEFRAGVLLWSASWHQVPAGSLPNDDHELAQLAGYGRVIKEWRKVKTMALHGWMLCSDGRLYHETVAGVANDAWTGKLRQRHATECSRIRKHNERHKTSIKIPDYETWKSEGCQTGQLLDVTKDNADMSQGQICETSSKRQGEGQGQGQRSEISSQGSEGQELELTPSKPNGHGKREEPDGFSEFYQAFPRHEDRRDAARAYAAALKRATPEMLLAGAKRYAVERGGQDPKFTKLPATWLNKDSWANGSAPNGNGHAGASLPFETPEQVMDRKVLRFKEKGIWLAPDGAPPGSADCMVPRLILEKHGYPAGRRS